MKKSQLWIVVCIVLFFSTTVSAQNNNIGLIGGINMSNIDVSFDGEGTDEVNDLVDMEGSTGFGIGGLLELGLNESMSLCFEPMYLMKGAHQSQDMGETLGGITGTPLQNEAMIDISLNASYIEIPILFKMSLGSGDMQPYIMAGPTIGILMGANLGINALGIGFDLNVKDLAKSTDYGIALGGGLRFPVGQNTFFVEGRYSMGMANVIDEDKIIEALTSAGELAGVLMNLYGGGGLVKASQEDEIDIGIEGKTKGIQIMAGFCMPLGG